MLNKKYYIGFTLGDPSNDGHGMTSEYHLVVNHPAQDIAEAYRTASRKLGFDFVERVGADYEPDYYIPQEMTAKLLEINAIPDEDGISTEEATSPWDTPIGCYEFDQPEDEFMDIFFNIVRSELPDIKWKTRELEEDRLYILEGAAYGFIE